MQVGGQLKDVGAGANKGVILSSLTGVSHQRPDKIAAVLDDHIAPLVWLLGECTPPMDGALACMMISEISGRLMSCAFPHDLCRRACLNLLLCWSIPAIVICGTGYSTGAF